MSGYDDYRGGEVRGAGPGEQFRPASMNSRHAPPMGLLSCPVTSSHSITQCLGDGEIKLYAHIHLTIFNKCQVLSQAGDTLPVNVVISARI